MNKSKFTKEKIKMLIIAFSYFLCIPLGNLVLCFKPLYGKVYYGQTDDIFYFGLSAFLLIIYIILLEHILKKKLMINFKRENTEMSLKRVIIVLAIVLGLIFIISAIIGFNVKMFYDLGKNLTRLSLGTMAAKFVYTIVLCVYCFKIIEAFQYAFDNFFDFKNDILNKYFPYGGICAMLTFGLYTLIWGLFSLSLLFFFLTIVYGIIYLLCDRSFIKTFASIALIMIF